MAHGAATVERLWDTCQIPDYRRIAPAAHAELVTTLFGFLMQKGKIPDAWFSAQIQQADRTDGDIDTLSGRIAQIRTWTFVANRPDWLADPEHWQGISRDVENKLSDALHERLTERFVDRRTSVLMRRLRENTMLNTEIGKTGEVKVEGHVIGRLDGFTFAPDAAEAGSDAKALQATAQKALAGEIDQPRREIVERAGRSVRADIGRHRALDRRRRRAPRRHRRYPAGATPAHHFRRTPYRRSARRSSDTARSVAEDAYRESCSGRCSTLSKAEDITGIARGIAFQLIEALGVLERQKIAAEMKDLDQASRRVVAQIWRTVRRLSHLHAVAAEARRTRAGVAVVGAEARQRRHLRAVRRAAPRRLRPHLVRGGQGNSIAMPIASLGYQAVRRARGARRYSGTPRRSDPPRAVVARRARLAESPPALSMAAASS